MEKMDLIDLQRILEEAVSQAFEEPCWVRAEINQVSVRNGHCHLELVQKEEVTDKLLAKAQAVIWASVYSILNPYFRTSTGMDFRSGLQVLLRVEPRMHPLYGLSLVVTDADPSYTIGGLELERRKTMERLEQEGILDMNRQLPFPPVPLRLAVISSEAAAGYQDFRDHIGLSRYGFSITLFPALMQGSDAPSSIISAMDQVIGSGSDFDVLVMIRGGGAATDLHCYDNYDLAANIAQFPIPVITGIGHHKDVHIADRVAHLALKTPTAVADYLDGHLAAEEEDLFRLSHNLERTVQRRIEDEKQSLNYFLRDIGGAVRWLLQQQEHLLELMEQRIKHNNPMNLLNKGYSLTLFRGKAVLDASLLKEGDKVQTILSKGSFGAVVHDIEN